LPTSLPEQGRHLRPAVQGIGRDLITIAAIQTPRRRVGITRFSILGLGHDPSPARSYESCRAAASLADGERWWRAGQLFLPVRVLSRLFAGYSGEADRGHQAAT